MRLKRVVSKRTGKVGYWCRTSDPATGKRKKMTFWFSERREAEKALRRWLEEREAVKLGLPDYSGWQMSFPEIVEKFLEEAPISSDRRRKRLKQVLERNDLGLDVVSDFSDLGKMTARCRKVVPKRGDVHVGHTLQPALKQLTAWATSVGLLPHDPLSKWKKIQRQTEPRKRHAFLPDEVNGITAAANERDAFLDRACPTAVAFKALLLTGNRPGVVLAAKVGDLRDGRIVLPPGNGKKRNGMAFLPPAFAAELRSYLAARGNPGLDAPLFASPRGEGADPTNISHEFRQCMALAFVRMCWPTSDPLAQEVQPTEVARMILSGRARGFDGTPPSDPKKIARRRHRVQAVQRVAAKIGPEVARLMENRDMYALRKTHISWARQIANHDSVKAQVGHAPQDVEERFYLDLVDASQSAQAVWDVLTGKIELAGARRRRRFLKLAAGAESAMARAEDANEVAPVLAPKTGTSGSDTAGVDAVAPQVRARREDRCGATRGIRTHDLRFTNRGSISTWPL